MYVSMASGHIRNTPIEVEEREDPENDPDITITCYPNGHFANIYISLTVEEAENLVADLQKELER